MIHWERIAQDIIHEVMVRMCCVHYYKLHVLRRLPMPFPLVYEPIVLSVSSGVSRHSNIRCLESISEQKSNSETRAL